MKHLKCLNTKICKVFLIAKTLMIEKKVMNFAEFIAWNQSLYF